MKKIFFQVLASRSSLYLAKVRLHVQNQCHHQPPNSLRKATIFDSGTEEVWAPHTSQVSILKH